MPLLPSPLPDVSITRRGAMTAADKIALDGLGPTTAVSVVYVATNGSDSNPGTSLLPFLTPQAAINSLPRDIWHSTTISIGLGNFPGFYIRGFRINPGRGVAGAIAGLAVVGTLVTATLSTGSATGTITSRTVGSLSTPSYYILNDSTQNWTPSALVGKLVEITAGTGLGQSGKIVSNTTTSMEVQAVSFGGATTGSGYTIKDQGTNITTPVTIPATVASASVLGSFGISVSHNQSPGYGAMILIDSLKVAAPTANFAIRIENNAQVTVARCDLVLSGSSTGLAASTLRMDGPGVVNVSKVFVDTTSTKDGIIIFGTGLNATLSGVVIAGGGTHQLSVGGQGTQVNCTQVTIDGGGIGVTLASSCDFTMQGCRITGVSSQAIRIRSNNATGSRSAPAVFMSLSGISISNCGTALEASGLSFVDNSIGVMVGTGNTIGISADTGARVQVHPSSTITGITELTLDGNNTTLAAMRAATPKLLSTSLLTTVYE